MRVVTTMHVLLSLLLAAGCAADGAANDDGGEPPPEAPTFVSSAVCSDCHSRIYAPGTPTNWEGMRMAHRGDPPTEVDRAAVGPYSLWSGTMMAHAAQDPYWLAKVRFEARETPAAAATIENTCLSCHAPAQQYAHRLTKQPMRLDALDKMGSEGVTCTVCHQITPERLGSAESFTAGFAINTEDRIYGPHADPFPMPMRMHTGKTPTESAHMLESTLCGTCHTVITPTLDAEGRTTGRFLEQATYLEWLASDSPGQGQTCQSCHMPLLTGPEGEPVEQFIAHTPHGGFFGPTSPRKPFAQHTFQGANVQMLGMLAELLPSERTVLEVSAARARKTLEGALELAVEAEIDNGGLTAVVNVQNKTGHKLPSGFPSRRLWLRLIVTDQAGRAVFESGGFDATTGDLLHAQEVVAPHNDVISRPEQTQIYEAVPASSEGRRTVSLMRAAKWAKDNRLLPSGFRGDSALPEGVSDLSVEPVGVGDDADFAAGGDRVHYRIAEIAGDGPLRVRVEALYQSFHSEHLAGMEASGASAEEAAFLSAKERHAAPVLVAHAETEVSR